MKKVRVWFAHETEGECMGKKESNVRPGDCTGVGPKHPLKPPIHSDTLSIGSDGRSDDVINPQEQLQGCAASRIGRRVPSTGSWETTVVDTPDPPEDPTEVKPVYGVGSMEGKEGVALKDLQPPPAVRDDGGKLKWHLLPIPPLLGLIKVFHGGAVKYAEDQWRGGMKFSRIYRSMISHFMKWLASNSSYDKELGTHHLMMVAWGCFVLYMYEVVYKFTEYDDRAEKGLLTDEDFEFIHQMIENKLGPLDEDDAAREDEARSNWIDKIKRGCDG
jgi:hypothetical protein